jgi:hypothetical protein
VKQMGVPRQAILPVLVVDGVECLQTLEYCFWLL